MNKDLLDNQNFWKIIFLVISGLLLPILFQIIKPMLNSIKYISITDYNILNINSKGMLQLDNKTNIFSNFINHQLIIENKSNMKHAITEIDVHQIIKEETYIPDLQFDGGFYEKFQKYLLMGYNNGNIKSKLRVFEDFSDRDILHRDVSPKNILIKKYDNFNVIKVSDFGLVKLPDSQFTAVDTDIRGYFNDLSNLSIVGFYKYDKSFEYYALTKLLYFVITGRYKNINKFDYDGLEEFVNIGLNSDLSKRFNSIQHLKQEFRKIKFII